MVEEIVERPLDKHISYNLDNIKPQIIISYVKGWWEYISE